MWTDRVPFSAHIMPDPIQIDPSGGRPTSKGVLYKIFN